MRLKSTLPVSRNVMSRASLPLSACSATCAGLSTRCRKMAAFLADAGRASRFCRLAVAGEIPLS